MGSTSGSESAQDEIVAYMILDGAIELTSSIPAYCTAACLNAGAPVTTAEGVCGNGDIEDSEECDDGGVEDDDGCSSVCLKEGNTQCPATCDDSGALCTNDASCEESCESAACSSASDVDEACTLDADCDSGSCSDEGACEDYEDAESSCTNNGACDSGSCVGSCSISGDACSGADVDCPYASGGSCELSGSGCCGDGSIDDGESCDDSNLTSGDGCSSICLNEGSRSVGATCGDGVQDWAANTGGEDCDDGNRASNDACSSNCLLEGSTSEEDVYAVCGDGTVDDGEDCDPGDWEAEGDGCSSSCLYEGTSTCPTSISTNCCGNGGAPETGEECDGDEGCSSRCLWAGSSYSYSSPSFCGDGTKGTGEECDAVCTDCFSVGDYGVSQISTGAPEEVNESTGYAISTVSVTVDGDVTGEATVRLQCSCTTDASCGEIGLGCGDSNCCYKRPTLVEGQVYPVENSGDLEAGEEGYCRNTAIWLEFSQMMDEATFDQTLDDDGDGVDETTDGDGIIQQNEFAANLYLDLVSVDSDGDGDQDDIDEIGDCPTGYDGAVSSASESVGVRFWHWIKSLVLGVFGREASASDTFACHVPVTYELLEIVDPDDGSISMRAYLRYSSLLEENAVYRLFVIGDHFASDSEKEGVLSENGVTLCIDDDCEDEYFRQEFEIGEDICDLDRVVVEDMGDVDATKYEDLSIQYFSSTGEEHAFTATPQTYRTSSGYEEISPLTDLYEWEWAWTSSETDAAEGDVVAASTEDPEDTTRNYTATGYTGREQVLSSAKITVDKLFETSTVGTSMTGKLEVTALVCENPWPALASTTLDFPYLEDVLPSNFSFYYCRDAGDTGTTDDLPGLEDPIDVTSLSSSGIIQELIFKVEDSSDAIGVRVLPNAIDTDGDGTYDKTYFSPSAWVEEQEFTGSFTATELDGYPAVEAGNTLYAAAANVNGTTIYPNIYIVSYNDNASEDAQEIFDQLLENWRFNGNTDDVTDINLCQNHATASYITTNDGEYVECVWDGDCFETCEESVCSVTGGTCTDDADCLSLCDAEKEKLTRDMTRLLDVVDMATTIDTFGESNGHCEVTKGQSCEADNECPGSEACVSGFPEVQSGTFVPALSNSIWSSWSASLGNDLGSALPTDPINEFYNCSEELGYDAASCWNGEEGTFICPENSHLYGYQSVGGEDYVLYAVLESDGGDYTWAYDLDAGLSDEVTVYAEYPTDYSPSFVMDGFSATPVFCDGSTWGDSALCGDGTQGAAETCEIGDTTTGVTCTVCVNSNDDTYDGVEGCASDSECGTGGTCSTGTSSYACAINSSNQCYWDTSTTSACVAYSCGNGVVETGETCDDGSLNGTYGHCDDLCGAGDAIYCGDGYLAASEQCDCGTTSTYTSAIADSSSWATIGPDRTGTTASPWCAVSNGQYDVDGNNCAYNCTVPGLSCGDGRVNGSEECDGDYEDWEGALCSDGLTTCTSDSDCDSGTCGATGYEAAGNGPICVGGSDEGKTCDSGCTDGTCSTNTYDLYRYRICESDCSWPAAWTGPVGGDQQCGNGTVEGDEECDDGNSSNNDECLNTCVENICGDDYVNVGVESCDDGSANGAVCSADYEDTCNYCNTSCQYKTASGGYCGDGEVDTGEVCDGGYATTLTYYDSTEGVYQSCETYDAKTTDPDDSSIEYTCQWLGVCNGGDENGEYCTLNYTTYTSNGTVSALIVGADTNYCTYGECIAPICADDCGSSCPVNYETTGLLVQSEASGAQTSDSIELYSYLNNEGDSPDNGVLYLPACNVATSITADIDDDNITPPDVDIVFVTDLTGSMNETLDGSRKIDLAVNSTIDAIEELFDAYSSTSSTLQIGLVSYTDDYGSSAFCNAASAETDGAYADSLLVGDSSEASLVSYIESYSTCVTATGGATPTYNGIEEAVNLLSASSAEVKIIVVLTDGDYDWIDSADASGGWTSSEACSSSYSKTYNGNTYTEKPACAADMYDDFMGNSTVKVLFYTAAITSDPDYQGYTAHISSNDCEWASSSSASDASDCSGNYAFYAESEDDIKTMYEQIVDSILGTNVTFTATNDAGDTTTTTGEVQAGSDVELPFPEGFVCQSTEQTIPVRNVFYGSGSILFSDFTMTYCPYE
ncbi:MAG TPA: hypothetical protein VJB64_02675 [Patescibacteria group bacterium]|nr:hypothetical protein [Patescibacteria group bacterium]